MKQAVIDMGSNSLRLLLAEKRSEKWYFGDKNIVTTRLGMGVAETGVLSANSMGSSMAALSKWKQQLGSVPVLVIATSAIREATNGNSFMTRIADQFGWQTRILSGEEEARFSFIGAGGNHFVGTKAVIDIGGGSTEVAVGNNGQLTWAHSYELGAVRCKFPEVTTASDITELMDFCESHWQSMPTPSTVIGVGGTLTSVAAMALSLRIYDPSRIHGYRLSRIALAKQIIRLTAMTFTERQQIAGLQPIRADIIIAGMTIAYSFMLHYEIDELQISEQDILEGALITLG